MNIANMLKFWSPIHDVQNLYGDDTNKGVNPFLDSSFIFGVMRFVSVAATVFFGVTIDPSTQQTLANNIPLLISAGIAIYAEMMKISAAWYASRKLAVTNAQVAVNTVKAEEAIACCPKA